MYIEKLIEKLEAIKEKYGNLEVVVDDEHGFWYEAGGVGILERSDPLEQDYFNDEMHSERCCFIK